MLQPCHGCATSASSAVHLPRIADTLLVRVEHPPPPALLQSPLTPPGLQTGVWMTYDALYRIVDRPATVRSDAARRHTAHVLCAITAITAITAHVL